MSLISVNHFSKYYTVYKKEPGFMGSVKSLLVRKYEEVKAVDDISFSVESGELIGFIGPNGAGKTTTLKSLTGLLYPTKGEVSVLGYTPFERKHAFLKEISLVMGQKNQLLWDLPAIDSFILNKEMYGIADKTFKSQLNELTELLDVKAFLEIPIRKLSLGQRMKMELIGALIHNPKVLFLDEPTIGLDVVVQKNLREFIAEYNKKYEATILLTSHYMKDVEALCKRVIMINHGKILFDGELSKLIEQYAPTKEVSAVLGNKISEKDIVKIGEVKRYLAPQITLRIPRAHIGDAVKKLIEIGNVEDLSVQDPDIEDVIRDIFSAKNPQES